jgi:hypothetical protein
MIQIVKYLGKVTYLFIIIQDSYCSISLFKKYCSILSWIPTVNMVMTGYISTFYGIGCTNTFSTSLSYIYHQWAAFFELRIMGWFMDHAYNCVVL